jgi:Flp pilus assembly pilin Flp
MTLRNKARRHGRRLARAAARRLRAAWRAALLHGQTGTSMVEYAIVTALIALVAMVSIQALGGGVATVFTNILMKIQGLGR